MNRILDENSMTAKDQSVLRTPQLEKLKKLLYLLRNNTERLDIFYKIPWLKNLPGGIGKRRMNELPG